MAGTLVVTLPSSHAGGELMVGLGEEWKSFSGPKYYSRPRPPRRDG